MRTHSKDLRQLGWRQRSGTTRGRLTGAMSQQQLLLRHRGRCRKTRFDLRHTAEINSYWRRSKSQRHSEPSSKRVLFEGATARKDAEEVTVATHPCGDSPEHRHTDGQDVEGEARERKGSVLPLSELEFDRSVATLCGSRLHTESLFRLRLRVRSQEPTTRGGLKAAHQAMRFYEEITAVPARLSESTVYSLAKKEFLAAALPGKFPRQAPRFPAALLAALEETVCDFDTTLCYRIYGWWVLVQCWGTLRFSDHRGFSP